MAAIHIQVPHVLGQAPAVERLRGFMSDVKNQYQDQFKDLQESWEGNLLRYSFKTFGLAIRGTMSVEPQRVMLDLELPFAAMMLKGKIEREIRESLEKALA